MVVGKVISDETGEPLPRQPVFLAQVYRQGDQATFVLNTAFSSSSTTDLQGRFAITNIDPQEYVMIVGNPYGGNYQIIPEEPDKARVWKLEADQTLDIGELHVNFGP